VPNRAVDVDSRALLACSILFGLDYIFTRPYTVATQRSGLGDGVLARF